ncbi:MAG TPA: hypothetical protein VFJ74_05745 [Gemmatimonadaceae bacterium]|nr:hypothetical protein [Gemmatimonadaceae bacterium]
MRTTRHLLAAAAVTVFAAATFAAPRRAGAQQEYPATLYWGSGLIDIPVAWVAPLTGDFALNYSGKSFSKDPDANAKLNYSGSMNSQLTFSMSFAGRAEVGAAAYSSNPEEGLFARGLLLREDDFRNRGTAAKLLVPSIAVGVLNVSGFDKIDRFGSGYILLPPTSDNPNAQHVADSLHRDFKTNNTFYGVATKTILLTDIRPSWPDLSFSFTAGYGNGLFKNHGSIPRAQYAKNATGGLFYGVKTDFAAGTNTTLSLMAENNAWDFNLGGSIVYRGLRAGLYVTELGAGSANVTTGQPSTAYYNYQKVAFTLGWQSNLFALLKGDFLQSRVARLERTRQQLLAEITARQQRIAALELELNRYEAQNLLELEQRRQQAEAELRAEREALRRLEERLKRVESQSPSRPPQR